MKQPSTPSSSTSSSAPSQESETGKASATSRGADCSSAQPPSGSSAKHGIEDAAPVSIKSFGVEVWNPSMSEEESAEREREVASAFKQVWKPGISQDELERLVREELQRRRESKENGVR